MRADILADLTGIHIDMDQDFILRDQIRLGNRAVRNSCADHEQ